MHSALDIITNRVNFKKGKYFCPWQSIHYQSVELNSKLYKPHVDPGVRFDAILAPKDLLTFDLRQVCEDLKNKWYRVATKYRGFVPSTLAIDPLKLDYDFWKIEAVDSFKTVGGTKYRPFADGFALAEKYVGDTGLKSISVAIFANWK